MQNTTQALVKPMSNTYTSKKLESECEIKMAQRLIYSVYVEELNWIPSTDNPSGIRLCRDGNSKFLVDDYDIIAMWFGTFYKNKLIACWRFCQKKEDKFELELYQPLPEFLKSHSTLECTRLAIDKEHRNQSGVLIDLYCQTHMFLHKIGYDYVFATATFPDPGNLYLKLGLKKHEIPAFKYMDSDPNEVSLIYFSLRDKKASQRIFRTYHRVVPTKAAADSPVCSKR